MDGVTDMGFTLATLAEKIKNVYLLQHNTRNKGSTGGTEIYDNIDNIVITDFGHGLISEKICKKINSINNNKYINCQANSSNFGYNKFTKYKYAKLL